MIKVANILPCNCINEKMPRQEVEMYLTHKVLEHPEVFAFLAKDKEIGVNSFKILDNSACELGEGMDFNLVLKAAEIIDAHEIVLPDIPRSGFSLTKTLQYLAELDENVLNKYSIAAVCQGETVEQVLRCAEQIVSLKSINTIMIPKWYCSLDSSNGLGRHDLTKEIIEIIKTYERFDMNIHWLGLDTGIRELITPLRRMVRSVDTGYLAALSTPQWNELHVTAERPRELKIDLESMHVDMERWNKLRSQFDYIIEEV